MPDGGRLSALNEPDSIGDVLFGSEWARQQAGGDGNVVHFHDTARLNERFHREVLGLVNLLHNLPPNRSGGHRTIGRPVGRGRLCHISVLIALPHPDHHLRLKANEPGIRLTVVRAGLSGGGSSYSEQVTGCIRGGPDAWERIGIQNALQHLRHNEGYLR